MVKRGRGLGHTTYFFKLWDPLISQEQLKIETSNFACRLTVRDTEKKNCKNGEQRAWRGSRDLLLNFGTSLISLEWHEGKNLKFCTRIVVRAY